MRTEYDGDASVGVVVARQGNALTRREEQLRRWSESETSKAPIAPKLKTERRSVNFPDGIVFLACCHSGDKEDIARLIKKGADINTANVDGLTALHQACIDDKLDMVQFLVDSGVDLDSCDNEGWTPLHATASCGYVDIAKCLIERGARVDCCNNDGHLPVDISAGDELTQILEAEMAKHGVDADAARKVEESGMLADATEWAASGRIEEQRHPKTGATALHVAAAKGYTAVMELLLSAGADANGVDNDGWSPLHAAAHWGEKEAARILVLQAHVDMEKVNKVGQTAFDVGDSKMIAFLEELRDKQLQANPMLRLVDKLRNDEEPRRSSVTRLSIDQKQRTKLRDIESISSLESSVDDDNDDEDAGDEGKDEEKDEEVDKAETDKKTEKSLSPVLRPASITLPVAGGASAGNPTIGTVTPMIRGASSAAPPPTTSATDMMETEPPAAEDPSYSTSTDLLPPAQPASLANPDEASVLSSSASQGQKRVFEPPKRDEESEAQRKAKSRRARETRRSTQGVTAEDLQAAEILLTNDPNVKDDGVAAAPVDAGDSAEKRNNNNNPGSDGGIESTSSVASPAILTPTSTATALADTLKQSDSFRRRARGSRHDTQDSISSTSSSASSSASSGSSSTSSTLTAGSVAAAASPVFSRSQRFGSSSSNGGGGGGDCGGEADKPPPAVIVTAGGDADSAASEQRSGGAGGDSSAEQAGGGGGLEVDSAYKRSSAITKRRLRAQRRSTGIPFDEDGDKKEGEVEEGAAPQTSVGDADVVVDAANNTQRYYRSSGSSSSAASTSSSSTAASSPATTTATTPSTLHGTTLSANTGIADRYARPSATATSYRQAAEMDFKKLYDEEKQENERQRMKIGRLERENAELRTQLEKNQNNNKSGSYNSNNNNDNNAFENVVNLKDPNIDRDLAETLEELKMLESLKKDNMRLKEENGALIRVISKLSK